MFAGKRILGRLVLAVGLTGLATVALEAQAVADRSCSDGGVVDALGLRGLNCSDCTIYTDKEHPENARWRFRSEPVVTGVDDIGPADGFIRPGDAIVLVDGYLITTKEGSRRFSSIQPGIPVELGVRGGRGSRNAGIRVVTLVPWDPCDTRSAADASARARIERLKVQARRLQESRLREPRVVVRPDTMAVAYSPQEAMETLRLAMRTRRPGWLGFSLTCSDCGIQQPDSGPPVWRFSSPPVINQVEPGGPAHRAGLRAGDRILRIDQKEITSQEAGRRFGAIEPGDEILIRVERDGNRNFAVRVRAGSDPSIKSRLRALEVARTRRGRLAYTRRPREQTLRYSGGLGNTSIEVTGAPVTVTQSEKEIVIQSGDITVRIRKDK